MYFFRFQRLPFVVGALIGLFLPIPEAYAPGAHLWGFICVSVMLLEHILVVCLSVRFGGFKEGVAVAGWALLAEGMTLPEFYQAAKKTYVQAHEEWEREHKLARDRAAAERAAMRAVVEERARRYSRRLARLMEGDTEAASQVSQQLAHLDPAAAEEKLRRAERLAMFLQQASSLGDQHMAHLTALFQRPVSLAEADRAAQAYLAKVRYAQNLLEEAQRLGVQAEVSRVLSQQGEEAANNVLIQARARAARHLELQTLQVEVNHAAPHDRGFLNELLADARAHGANPREFRKAVHALRQKLPKNGHVR